MCSFRELPWPTTSPLFFWFTYLLFILHTSHVGHHRTVHFQLSNHLTFYLFNTLQKAVAHSCYPSCPSLPIFRISSKKKAWFFYIFFLLWILVLLFVGHCTFLDFSPLSILSMFMNVFFSVPPHIICSFFCINIHLDFMNADYLFT